MKILLVEDNIKLATYIIKMLEYEYYEVEHMVNGLVAEQLIKKNIHDLIILDLMLPGKDGLLVCKSLRKENIMIPILILTARTSTNDTIIGLDAGADDYLAKPFNMLELRARVAALLRRPKSIQSSIFEYKSLKLDTSKHTLYRKTKEINLTAKEFILLEYLIQNIGITLSREKITRHCWDIAFEPNSNIVDAYIKQLRKKIETKHEKYITTIRSFGYKFE